MTIEKAIALMKNEKACIVKSDTCDRNCAKCELVRKTENLLSAYDMAIKALEQTKWIPCSERLPEEDGDYLLFGKVVEDEENNIFIGEYDSCGEQFGIWQEQFDRTTLGCLGSEFYEYASVLAWMPLAKPYNTETEIKE